MATAIIKDYFQTLLIFLYTTLLNTYVHFVIWLQDNTGWLRNMRNQIICIRSEPVDPKWISISGIVETTKDYNMFYYDDINGVFFRWFIYSNYNDNYEWFEEYIPRIEFDKTRPFMDYCDDKLDNDSIQIQPCCPIVIVKQDSDHQVVKLLDATAIKPTLNMVDVDHILFFKSKVSFLSILYIHPKMKEEVALKIPKSMYYVGNQILSTAFVYRLLEYTVGYMFYFDMNYQLKLMDNNMQYVELKSDQYIELEYNSYKIGSQRRTI
jgi:hypothetical protein